MKDTKLLLKIADNPRLLEIGRKAVEDTLIDFRDARISFPSRNNGLVIKDFDGTPSDIIRMGAEGALKIGLLVIAKYLEKHALP